MIHVEHSHGGKERLENEYMQAQHLNLLFDRLEKVSTQLSNSTNEQLTKFLENELTKLQQDIRDYKIKMKEGNNK